MYSSQIYLLRFVFMALMEYCLVNIILGESLPKPALPPQPPKPQEKEKEKIYEFANKNGSGKRESRIIQNSLESPHPAFLRNSSLHSVQTENAVLITQAPIQHIPPPPKPAVLPQLTVQQARLRRAIYVDRTSRVLFPAMFASLNFIYWIMFWKYV
jgi:histamine-gated chloride channel